MVYEETPANLTAGDPTDAYTYITSPITVSPSAGGRS
jgi:hypothetical protein